MFEKEAEEYAKKLLNPSLAYAFKDGAEFDFQKGIKAKINTTTISDYPVKDEWHYVKDGDYPKEYKDLWICFITEDSAKDYVRGWYEYDLDEDEHYFKTVNTFGTVVIRNVYAWQILVPPDVEEE